MNKKKTIVIAALSAIIIISALCVTIIALNARIRSMRILDYREAGLGGLSVEEIVDMQVESYARPKAKGSIVNEELIDELRELLEQGVFQRTGKPTVSRNDGAGAYSTVRFKTLNGEEYTLTVNGGAVYISAPFEEGWFFSNIKHGIQGIVKKAQDIIETQG